MFHQPQNILRSEQFAFFKTAIVLWFLGYLFSSCNSETAKQEISASPDIGDAQQINIKFSDFKDSIGITTSSINTKGYYNSVFVIDTFLVCTTLQDTTAVHIYSARSFKKLNEIIKVGDGKGQVLQVYSIVEIDSSASPVCWLYDLNLKKLLKIDIIKAVQKSETFLLDEISLIGEKRNLSSPHRLTDSLYVAASFLSPDFRYFYFNLHNDSVRKIGKFPRPLSDWPKDDRKSQFNMLARTYNGKLSVHPSGKRLVFAYKTMDRIELYEGDSLTKVIRGPDIFNPIKKFVTVEGIIVSQEFDKTRFAYIDISSDDQYVYLLYSGKDGNAAFGNRLLIYDWKGIPILRCQLSTSIASFSLQRTNGVVKLFGTDSKSFDLIVADIPLKSNIN